MLKFKEFYERFEYLQDCPTFCGWGSDEKYLYAYFQYKVNRKFRKLSLCLPKDQGVESINWLVFKNRIHMELEEVQWTALKKQPGIKNLPELYQELIDKVQKDYVKE
ncbi:hypothetical protein [Paenibacillus protaetiae]|uniref:Uncharacterized protein n=1 Tax=Paenibacillus protaetiae TaxID=2509456 RepID=A0A4V0YF37_9BACL|nr:hypothetical protein [Paenibacillus protaetiae]QAY66351.1 hypothetical protein ET464_07970 [Paenibacillus protaetiae]